MPLSKLPLVVRRVARDEEPIIRPLWESGFAEMIPYSYERIQTSFAPALFTAFTAGALFLLGAPRSALLFGLLGTSIYLPPGRILHERLFRFAIAQQAKKSMAGLADEWSDARGAAFFVAEDCASRAILGCVGVKLKHNANRAVVQGKRVVLVDDSIVRGTTSVKIVRMMYEAGAKEVHMRISSPPIKHPDFYGIDTPEQKSLLAATHTLEEMRQYIGVDSLAFVSVDGVYRAVGYPGRDNARPQFTDHCFTGDYPTHLTDLVGETKKQQLSLLAEAG